METVAEKEKRVVTTLVRKREMVMALQNKLRENYRVNANLRVLGNVLTAVGEVTAEFLLQDKSVHVPKLGRIIPHVSEGYDSICPVGPRKGETFHVMPYTRVSLKIISALKQAFKEKNRKEFYYTRTKPLRAGKWKPYDDPFGHKARKAAAAQAGRGASDMGDMSGSDPDKNDKKYANWGDDVDRAAAEEFAAITEDADDQINGERGQEAGGQRGETEDEYEDEYEDEDDEDDGDED
jgi:hypothetical protein